MNKIYLFVIILFYCIILLVNNTKYVGSIKYCIRILCYKLWDPGGVNKLVRPLEQFFKEKLY